MTNSDINTTLKMASSHTTGEPFYTGEIIYTFIGGRLANTNPKSTKSIKSISRLFKGYPLLSEDTHLSVKMASGLIHGKEEKTINKMT